MYTQNGNPVPGLGAVPLPSGPVAGGHFNGPSELGQDVPDAASSTEQQERYVRVTEEPTEIVPVASAADAKALIEELQMRLKMKGQDPGDVDGLWGPKTAGALDAGRIAAEIPKGTNRVLVIQSVIGVSRADAGRINDAINYQIAAKAERKKAAAAAAAAAGQQQPVITPEGDMVLPTATAAGVPLHKKWWFWGLLAAGVVTAGVVTYVVIKKRGEEEEFYPEGGEVQESFVEAEGEEF